jgi:hypothetical protein
VDEPGWLEGPAASDFVQMQPIEVSPATEAHRSEVRFRYDDENLYVGATFFEDEPDKLVTNDLKRDFPGARDGDLYVLVIDTFNDRLNAYNFQTNPGCALRDSQSYDDGRSVNANWDTVWDCRSSVGPAAWYVEEAIPFKQLRFPQGSAQTWGVNVFRLIRHTNEQTVWNQIPRQFNQFKTSYAGVLEGISGVNPGRNKRELRPVLQPDHRPERRRRPDSGRRRSSADRQGRTQHHRRPEYAGRSRDAARWRGTSIRQLLRDPVRTRVPQQLVGRPVLPRQGARRHVEPPGRRGSEVLSNAHDEYRRALHALGAYGVRYRSGLAGRVPVRPGVDGLHDQQWLSNVRFDFIHHPLSDIFIVYNDTRYQDGLQPARGQVPTRALILKVTHLLSF